PRIVLPRRSQARSGGARQRAAEGSGRRSRHIARDRAAVLPVASRRDGRDPRHAQGEERREQHRDIGERAASPGRAREGEEARLGPELLFVISMTPVRSRRVAGMKMKCTSNPYLIALNREWRELGQG